MAPLLYAIAALLLVLFVLRWERYLLPVVVGFDAGMVAFERFTASERVLVVINTGDQEAETTSGGNPMQVSFAPGTVLSDRLGTLAEPLTVAADGTLAVTLAAKMLSSLSSAVLLLRCIPPPL